MLGTDLLFDRLRCRFGAGSRDFLAARQYVQKYYVCPCPNSATSFTTQVLFTCSHLRRIDTAFKNGRHILRWGSRCTVGFASFLYSFLSLLLL